MAYVYKSWSYFTSNDVPTVQWLSDSSINQAPRVRIVQAKTCHSLRVTGPWTTARQTAVCNVLTWSRVAGCAVRIGIVSTKAGAFLETLENDVTTIRGSVVAFFQ